MAEAFVTFEDIETILVKKVGLAPQVLVDSPESSLEELGLDSLAVLELQIVITKQYGVEIPDESAELSVGEIVGFINKAAVEAA
jgi:acyl carrier protein